jgi:preprotein translocase subunit YajC
VEGGTGLEQLYAFLPYVLLIAVFYFLLIRPQQKREKETQKMRSNVKEGDEILTIGGIYGKIVNIKDDVLTIEVGADKVKIKIAKWAVGKVITE